MLLAGDIGGTRTRLALYRQEIGPQNPVREAVYQSAQYQGLRPLVGEFLGGEGPAIAAACFGVAGPVRAGRVTLTNLPWILDEGRLASELGIPRIRLLNDLEALATVLPHLGPGDLHTLHEGQTAIGGALAVVAAGTGLGMGFLTWDGAGYRAHASEGGHVDFGPRTPRQEALLHFLKERFGRVSVERIASGLGLANLYDFLTQSGLGLPAADLAGRIRKAPDRTPLILEAALDPEHPCPVCQEALSLFVSVLGAAAGNFALATLSTAGLYLGGGIPPRILPWLDAGSFLEAFWDKGRYRELLTQVPIRVITRPDAGLLGAAMVARRLATGVPLET